MGELDPITFRLDTDFNVNKNRWDRVETQSSTPNTIWEIDPKNLPPKTTIGELLGTKRKTQIAAPKKTVTPAKTKTTETEGETPKPEEQISQAEKDRVAEEKLIKSFSAIAGAKLLSDEAKIDFIRDTSEYIKSLGKNATYDESFTDPLGNYHSVGTTENGNSIELITGKGPDDSATKRIKITTSDGTSLILFELSGEKTAMTGIASNTNGKDNTVTTSGISYRKELEDGCISKVAVHDSYKDADGNIQTNTTTQTYNADGSRGYAFYEESAYDGLGNASGQAYIGSLDENGDFNSITENPLNSWDRTTSSYTSYDANGNITLHEDLSQQEMPQEPVSYDAPLETVDETPADTQPAEASRHRSILSGTPQPVESEDVPEISPDDEGNEEIPQVQFEGGYAFEAGQTNNLENVDGTLRKQ